jgi:agmatine deiminase
MCWTLNFWKGDVAMVRSHITSKCLTFRLLGLFAMLPLLAGAARAADDVLLTTPPPKPVRIPAEFEPMQGVVVSWEMVLDKELYKYITQDVNLILFYDSTPARQQMQSTLTSWGANMKNCVFLPDPGIGVPRDEMPWFMFTDQNVPAFVLNLKDGVWRIPGFPYSAYSSGLREQGGNFMTDGQGTAVSINTSVSDNGLQARDEVVSRAGDYWGIHAYYAIVNPPGYPAGHIDCVAKLLSPDTLMVTRPPATYPGRQATDEVAAYFRRQVSCYGTPYRVARVDADPNVDEPYANSLIVNRRVYVPIVYHAAADAAALDSYRAAMPGYEVIGVPNPLGKKSWWFASSALHCDTMGIADDEMLYIEHVPLLNRPPDANGFPVAAKIIAHSRREFVDGTPVVLWRASTDANATLPSGAWNSTPMTRAPELGKDQYLAHVPTQAVGTTIQYYLQAKDASGRNEKHPYIGEPQAHTFTVTALGANVSAVSARRGGTIEICMNAGVANAQQDYRLTYSVSADSETAQSPGAVLPDTTVCTGFGGKLDAFGIGTARMRIPQSLPHDWSGTSIRFRLEFGTPPTSVSDTIRVQILD